MTQQWQVMIDGRLEQPLTEDQIDLIAGKLAEHDAALSVGEHDLGVTLTVDAQTAAQAVADGVSRICAALEAASVALPYDVYAGEAITVDEADRRLAQPTIPELVGAVEAAEILKVTRQRVHQLASENPRFPAPVVTTATASLWTKASIEAFGKSWTRKPGRPRKPKLFVDITWVDSNPHVTPGQYECTRCGQVAVTGDVKHLPPCPNCSNGTWNELEAPVAVGSVKAG